MNEILNDDTHVSTVLADMALPLNPVSDASMYGELADFYGGKDGTMLNGAFIV